MPKANRHYIPGYIWYSGDTFLNCQTGKNIELSTVSPELDEWPDSVKYAGCLYAYMTKNFLKFDQVNARFEKMGCIAVPVMPSSA